MPDLPYKIADAIWAEVETHIPKPVDTLSKVGRPRISDRVVFDRLLRKLVSGSGYQKVADRQVSATTLRRRWSEWITAGLLDRIEQRVIDAFDRIVGLDLENLAVDGCVAKAPCGGEVAGPSPVDRGKGGVKRSLLVDGSGIPLGVVVAPANRNDSPLLRPTMEKLSRFGFFLPDRITVHLDAGYDSSVTRDLLEELGCDHVISKRGTPLQAGKRWTVERTHSWHNNFGQLRRMTERCAVVAHAWIQLANAIITLRQLIRRAWPIWRWDSTPPKPIREWR